DLHSRRDGDLGDGLLHRRALAEFLEAQQAIERNAEEDADDADHDHQLHQREAAGLQRRSATRERSQIGRNTPRARIRTITPRNTIRMGSIWAASVLMS